MLVKFFQKLIIWLLIKKQDCLKKHVLNSVKNVLLNLKLNDIVVF